MRTPGGNGPHTNPMDSVTIILLLQRYGQIQNLVYNWLQPGIPASQRDSQAYLKSSEGCEKDHQNPLSRDIVVLPLF